MNIGFFGDSYLDFDCTMVEFLPDEKRITWSKLLYDEFSSEYISSGKNGQNQYYAIQSWQKAINSNLKFDVAIFSFTWEFRLYSDVENHRKLFAGVHEHRLKKDLTDEEKEIIHAVDLYFKYINSDEQCKFIHELMIKFILDLPKQYPEIKFIFIPNNTLSQEISKKYFTDGVLLDFAFEKITEIEGDDVFYSDPNKVGHLLPENHYKFKEIIKDIILNYNQYQKNFFAIDYEHFRINK